MNFFATAYNDASEYDGYLIICMRDKDDNFKTVKYVKRSEINDFITCKFTAYPCIDYYITANTFTRMSRTSALLSYNNIVIDIDAHDDAYINGVPPDAENEINDFIWRCKRDQDIPTPTIIHRTGRGVQLWYHFEQISSKCSVIYNATVNALVKALQAVIDDNTYKYIAIDSGASCRPAGLFRLFNTHNTKTGKATAAEVCETEYTTIHDLTKLLDEHLTHNNATISKKPPIKSTDCNYANLHKARLNVLVVLAEQQNNTGKRNTICWLSYNSLVQLYDVSKAQNKLEEINRKFAKPLRQSEIKAVYRSIEKKEQYYDYITVKGFCNILGISETFYYEHSNPQKTERKRKADAKQAKRDRIVSDLHAGVKQKDIAEKYGIGLRTVKRIAAEIKQSNINNKSAC